MAPGRAGPVGDACHVVADNDGWRAVRERGTPTPPHDLSRYGTAQTFAGGKDVDDVEYATAEWVDWFNHRRLYEYCGDIPPAELETAYYAQNSLTPPAEVSHQ